MKNKASYSDRAAYLRQLTEPGQQWDLLVIGGGATGLGVALEATVRGYRTLLIEQTDFAKGTSSRSTKLIHGGVRYLAQGNLKLVREASVERGRLLRNAPHLVRDQHFIVPVYSWWDRIKYTAGLKLYDRIAGRFHLGPSVFITGNKVQRMIPGIRTKGLKGGVLYHDGQFDDARLAINLAQTIWEKGGHAINYVKMTALHKNGKGIINGAEIEDAETGSRYHIQAAAVVNATGVFVDDILQMDNPGSKKSICVSQGAHLVIDKSFYPSAAALMIPKTSDGRVLFAVPWHDKVVLGTTDIPVAHASLEPQAMEKEISFILDTAGDYLEKKPTRKDVLSVFAGQRPLAAPGKRGQKTKEISRSHQIIVSHSHLFTMLGGKWTVYRKMGEDMVDKIEQTKRWPARAGSTATLAIHGHTGEAMNPSDPFFFYGSDAVLLRSSINGDTGDWVSASLHIHQVQIVWAVEHEMARTVEDVLARRTRALFLDAGEAERIAPRVAGLMAAILGKNEAWQQQQLQQFTELSRQYRLQ